MTSQYSGSYRPPSGGAPGGVAMPLDMPPDFASIQMNQQNKWDKLPPPDPPSVWNKVKFVLYLVIVVCLIIGIVGLSVTMAIISDGREDSSVVAAPPPPPLPPAPPGGWKFPPSPPPNVKPNGKPSPPPPVGVIPTEPAGPLVIMSNPSFVPDPGYTALWWDEFDGTSIDQSVWNIDMGYGEAYGLWAWGNKEQQYYTDRPENLNVANGFLKITALREDTVLDDGYTFKYTSGRLNTFGKVGFYPGMATSDGRVWRTIKMEAYMKAPTPTQGLWIAWWLNPEVLKYGVWSSSGEIDLFEMKNEMTGNNIAIHYGGPYPKYNERDNDLYRKANGKTYAAEFTKIALEWSETTMSFYLDDDLVEVKKSRSIDPSGWYTLATTGGPNAPFDIPFYMILNLAIGGKYPGDATESTLLPAEFVIDYIRVTGKEN